jgi:hypothetical protein
MSHNRFDYMKSIFRQTRQMESEWFEADNLDKIRLIIEDDEVVVENEHGSTYDMEELSEQEVDIITDNLENTDQYVIDELYYVKEKQTYDDGSPNGLVNIRLYIIEDNRPLKFGRTLEVDDENVIDDVLYEVLREEGYYFDNVPLKEL